MKSFKNRSQHCRSLDSGGLKPNTHRRRRRRRDSTVELSRVGGVKAPVGSRDPVYNFMCCCAIEVGDK